MRHHQLQISLSAAGLPKEWLVAYALSINQQLRDACTAACRNSFKTPPLYFLLLQNSSSVISTESTPIQAAAWLRPVACHCQLVLQMSRS